MNKILNFEIKHGATEDQFINFGFVKNHDVYVYSAFVYQKIITLKISVDLYDYHVAVEVYDYDGSIYAAFYNEELRRNNEVAEHIVKKYNDIILKGKRAGLFYIKKEQSAKSKNAIKQPETDNASMTSNDTKTIKIKYFDDEIEKITKIEQGDWIDLRSAEDVVIKKGEYHLIKLGVAMQLPKGYEAHVVPRSSTYKNFGIIQTNHQGVIDESYCGDQDQWHYPAYALRDTVIHKNDRICQFRIMKKQSGIKFVEVKKLRNKNRGGIGSTGKK